MSRLCYLSIISLISIGPYLCLVFAGSIYVKSLVKRACFSKGFARVVEAYKAEVASLTSERADRRAQVRHLTKDTVKYKSDLKHTSMAKSRAEEQEKKARDELRASDCEMRMVRDELQIARDELKAARGDLRVVRVEQQADKEEL